MFSITAPQALAIPPLFIADTFLRCCESLLKSRPPLLFEKSKINSLTVGNITDHFDSISKADWIIEAVVERIDIKHKIYDQIFKERKKDGQTTKEAAFGSGGGTF